MPNLKIIPYGDVIGYDARTRQPVRRYRKYEKPFNWYKLFFWVVMILMFIAMTSCSYMPVYDPKGSQAKNFYGDLQECRFTAQSQMSGFQYGYHEEKVIKECMTNRDYSILK